MRINELKAKVYGRCGVSNTPQLKKEYNELTQGKDLRFKASWQAMLEELTDDYTIADMERDDQLLKQSLHRVGRVLGHSYQNIEDTWGQMNTRLPKKGSKSIKCKQLASLETR